MRTLLAFFTLAALGVVAVAAPVIPATLHPVPAKDGKQEIKVEPKDLVELRIPNPALPKRVHDLDVTVAGDGILAGVVNTTEPRQVGSDRISVFVGLKGTARSATIRFSYKDGQDTEHTGELIIQVIRPEKAQP